VEKDKMKIKDLNKMEKLVSKYNNLNWVGWDVADRRKTEAGRTAVNGIRVNGEWYVQTLYPLTTAGWDIPDKYRM
jgi:hypothetical protein